MSEKTAYFIMFITIPLVWIAAKEISGFPDFLLPPPGMVVEVLWNEYELFLEHTWVTLFEALTGYLIANILAISLAITFLYIPWFESLALPWTVVIKNIPFVTIASILIITMGDTPAPKIIIVILVTFFPILANVTKGLQSTDQVLLDRMKTLHANHWQVFCKVRWPSAIPYYIAAHEIAFTGSIIAAIIAEWLFARKGLGFLIVQAMSQYRADRLYAVTLVASLLAVGAYILVKVLERRLSRWQDQTLT